MRRPTVLAAALVLAVGACKTEKADLTLPVTETNVTGTFNLTLANGSLLPFTALITNTEVWTMVADKIVIAANNTWVDSTNYTVLNRNDGTTAPRSTATAGTWGIANSQINFVMTTGGTAVFIGAVVGNSLSVNFNNQRYQYSR